jgi:hypothetical protein
MSRRIREAPSRAFVGATAASALLALAVAPAASAARLYTCVNTKSGAMRLVAATAKCKHGERKLSWNAAGPAGAQGAPGSPGVAGSPGAAGSNGVGADYASFSFGPSNLAASEKGDVVVSKTIPAGSYFVNAKTVVGAAQATKAVFVGVICELVDTSGTVGVVELPQALDLGEWQQQLSNSSGSEYDAASTIAMQAQLTTTEPTTLALVCVAIEGSKEATVLAVGSQLSALQTTANK